MERKTQVIYLHVADVKEVLHYNLMLGEIEIYICKGKLVAVILGGAENVFQVMKVFNRKNKEILIC